MIVIENLFFLEKIVKVTTNMSQTRMSELLIPLELYEA